MSQQKPKRVAAPDGALELLPAPGGGEPDRILRVRFGPFIEGVLASGVDPEAPGPDGGAFAEHLSSLARGADLLHDVMNGYPPLDGDVGPYPGALADYFLSLGDRQLDAAHAIAGFDADYGLDPNGDRLGSMVRLTDHLDPEGHAFRAHFDAVRDAEPTENPGPAKTGPGREPTAKPGRHVA